MTTESLGAEWLVDAHACDPGALRSLEVLQQLFERAVAELGLHPAAEPVWHVFPGEAGITGLWLLQESHLACHTFPERGFAAFNLYCCRPRPAWAWAERLTEAVQAQRVTVRHVTRGEEPQPGAVPAPATSAITPAHSPVVRAKGNVAA